MKCNLTNENACTLSHETFHYTKCDGETDKAGCPFWQIAINIASLRSSESRGGNGDGRGIDPPDPRTVLTRLIYDNIDR